jgi:hypothetical protein
MNTEDSFQPKQDLAVGALESIERAQIDMQIATAKRYPRTLSKVKQDMLSFATLDEDTASACFYTLPRGGKAIQGPSVRLAEIAVACYGNLRAGSRILQTVTEGPNPHVVVQSVAHDLERNTAITIEKRRRITKKKHKDTIDEDDINLACNACSAVAFRDAVFKVVPQALIKPVWHAAKKVAVGEAKSLVETRGKIFDRLKQMGVTEDRILAVIECRKVEDVTLEHIEVLIGLGTAIKDGEVRTEEAFPLAIPSGQSPESSRPLFQKPETKEAAKPEQVEEPPKRKTHDKATETQQSLPVTGGTKKGSTPQERLQKLVIENGYTWEDFKRWGVEAGEVDADCQNFSQLPETETIVFLDRWDDILANLEKGGGK